GGQPIHPLRAQARSGSAGPVPDVAGAGCRTEYTSSASGATAARPGSAGGPSTPAGRTAPTFPPSRWTEASSATDAPDAQGVFWVTHPYHPLTGQRLVLVQYQHTWGDHRAYY